MQIRRLISVFIVVLVSAALLFFDAGDVMALKVGDKAPDFNLVSVFGNKVGLNDYKGKKNVILIFYADNS